MSKPPPKSLVEAGLRWALQPSTMVRELFGIEPDAWQVRVLDAFPRSPKLSMTACKGPGKREGNTTEIYTLSGPKKFGDLQVGDLVFAEDGSPSPIIGVYPQGKTPILRVTFDDGSFLRVGAEHLWKVQGRTERRKNLGWAVLTTQEIIDRGVTIPNGRWAQKQFVIPRQGAAQFPHAALPVDPYVFGVWLGDGTVGAGQYTKPYTEVEDEIRQRGYATQRRADGKTVSVRGLSRGLRQAGCLELRCWEKSIPDAYKMASIAQRKDLLCGLMDTDGSIGKDGHMEFAVTSEALAIDIVWLVRSLGGVALIKEAIKEGWYYDEAGEKVECRDCYRVTVVLDFNPFRIGHKAERWRNPTRSKSTERYLTRFIADISPDGEEEATCIEIAHPSHCYQSQDFIVTHNTTVLAWLCLCFLLTRQNCNIAATSISGDNLKDGLLKEISKWYQRCPLLQEAFQITNTRIFSKQHEKNWWMSFRTWPKTGDAQAQAATLAGLHEDNVMFVLDEAGDIPPAVLVTAEAALSSCVEGHILMAGNPTSLDGALYQATKDRIENGGKWRVFEITGDPDDPYRAPRVSIEWARDEIRKHGRENPWVLVNVFGRFPPSSLNALIGEDEVRAAMKRFYHPWDVANMAKVLGVDVARQGAASSVIARRQGLQMHPFKRYRGLTGIEGASLTNRIYNEFEADAVFIDATGGFGFAWIDQLSNLGRTAIPVGFAEEARDPVRYANRRAEMALTFVDWIKAGGALPPEESEGAIELLQALIHTTYTFKGDRFLLEAKEDVTAKIGYSPDEFDAAILTHAEPVTAKKRAGHVSHNAAGPYDPFADLNRRTGGGYSAVSEYSPFKSY